MKRWAQRKKLFEFITVCPAAVPARCRCRALDCGGRAWGCDGFNIPPRAHAVAAQRATSTARRTIQTKPLDTQDMFPSPHQCNRKEEVHLGIAHTTLYRLMLRYNLFL
jgi:hypothetical protein